MTRGFRQVAPALVLALVASVSPVPAAASSNPPSDRVGVAASDLRVMQWNMWFGGTNVNHYRRKQLNQIGRLAPDVITMQETYGVRARQLGRQLGWDYYQISYSLGILSRKPILERLPRVRQGGDVVAAGVRIDLGGGHQAQVWTTHLAYDPYGPYDACFSHMTPKQLREREREAGRPQELKAILSAMSDDLDSADAVPVILGGDFNSPSHLDWVRATSKRHCGYGHVEWPVTRMAEDAGLADSYRSAHPDPAARPGTTWSPIYPRHQGSTGRKEPQDRIDFLLYAGSSLRVADSRVFVAGDPKPYGEHQHNRWTSDHAAVITDFAAF